MFLNVKMGKLKQSIITANRLALPIYRIQYSKLLKQSRLNSWSCFWRCELHTVNRFSGSISAPKSTDM